MRRTSRASESDCVAAELMASGACVDVRPTSDGSGVNLVECTERGLGFVKTGTGGVDCAVDLLEYELLGLQHMRRACLASGDSIRVPEPWACGTIRESGVGFIVMDYIKFSSEEGRGGRKMQKQLGRGLAMMHSNVSEEEREPFGFRVDGCCGSAPQPNNAERRAISWVEFWREYRLGAQLQMAAENHPGDRDLQERGGELSSRLDELFSMIIVEDIRPSLLHGDLWSGNYAVAVAEEEGGEPRPCLFDPAAYYGHAEADLGIANMFGGFSGEFWTAYHEVLPKKPGHDRRALLYELHHHLNHYNIFGASYRRGCLDLINRILS